MALIAMTAPRAAWADAPAPARSPEILVRGGAVFPMFLIYEAPGPLLGVSAAFPLGPRLAVVGRGELGGVFFQGAQRYLAKIGGGVRAMPWPTWPVSPFAQLGLGMTAHVERISVVLPQRTASATDVGAVITADVAVGVRFFRRVDVSVGWDHIVVPWRYYDTYTGTESLPNRGYVMASLGVRL